MSSEPLSQTVVFQLPNSAPPINLSSAPRRIGVADVTPWLWALVVIVAALLIGLLVIWRRVGHD